MRSGSRKLGHEYKLHDFDLCSKLLLKRINPEFKKQAKTYEKLLNIKAKRKEQRKEQREKAKAELKKSKRIKKVKVQWLSYTIDLVIYIQSAFSFIAVYQRVLLKFTSFVGCMHVKKLIFNI